MTQPQYSEDGRFFWDGTRWVPLPIAAGKIHVVAHAAAWRWFFFWGFVAVFLLAGACKALGF